MTVFTKYKKQVFYLSVILIIEIIQQFPSYIEKFYSGIIYHHWAIFLRYFTSFLKFSIGDVLYLILGVSLFYKCYLVVRDVYFFKNERKNYLKKHSLSVFNFFCVAFIVFKLFWGLNYYRQGVAKQFNIAKEGYCKEQLNALIDELIVEANYTRSLISDTSLPKIDILKSYEIAIQSYQVIAKKYNFLAYHQPSIKSSMFSKLGNYSGFVGYFNPISGEAQVRNDIPEILIPFIATHEIAHQLGYANESEASFIGYLVCKHSNNVYFNYSLQLELLDLALNDLMMTYLQDGEMENLKARYYQINDCLSEQIKKDRKTIKHFFNRNRKPVASFSNTIYDKYLKINNQFTGIESYNEVLGWILVEIEK